MTNHPKAHLLGHITSFDALQRSGEITCKSLETTFVFNAKSDQDGESLRVGDLVSFELLRIRGSTSAEAIGIKLIGRKPRPRNVQHNTVQDLNTARPETPISHTGRQTQSHCPNDKEECRACGKYMVPTLMTFQGKPQQSCCPFCAAQHRDFNNTTTGSGYSAKHLLADGAVGLVFTALLGL